MSEDNLLAWGTIDQGDQRFSSLSRGYLQYCFIGLSALSFDRLSSPVLQKISIISYETDQMVTKYLGSLQKGLIPDTKTLSINNLPFVVSPR